MATAEFWQKQQFITIRRKIFTFLGKAFHIYDHNGALVAYSRSKAFKLREEIIVWEDESKSQEVLRINARNVIDFGATYDIVDATTGQRVGALRRRGLKSLVRDTWFILNPDDQQIGTIVEDSTGMALARRFLPLVAFFAPQVFHVELAGSTVCVMKQNRNPFVRRLTVDRTLDQTGRFDARLALAAGLLLQIIEGRESDNGTQVGI